MLKMSTNKKQVTIDFQKVSTPKVVLKIHTHALGWVAIIWWLQIDPSLPLWLNHLPLHLFVCLKEYKSDNWALSSRLVEWSCIGIMCLGLRSKRLICNGLIPRYYSLISWWYFTRLYTLMKLSMTNIFRVSTIHVSFCDVIPSFIVLKETIHALLCMKHIWYGKALNPTMIHWWLSTPRGPFQVEHPPPNDPV